MKQKTNVPFLKEHYINNVVPEMMKKYKYKNIYQVPKLDSIVVNIGLSEAKENPKIIEIAQTELSMITGQKPKICKAKKSISNFRLRKNMPIGLKVTLRGRRAYEFLHRFIVCALPRIRDFQGLSLKGFDKHGNYNLGLNEQYIFPEIDLDKSEKARGMNISFIIKSSSKEQSKDMLLLLGMPFGKR